MIEIYFCHTQIFISTSVVVFVKKSVRILYFNQTNKQFLRI